MKHLCVCVCVLALASAGASAVMVADFEDGVNPFSGGAVVADPEDAGNLVYQNAGGNFVMTLPAPLAVGETLTMRIYDQGKAAVAGEGSYQGWSAGVATMSRAWGVRLAHRTWFNSNSGYGYPATGNWLLDLGNQGTIYGIGVPRQVDALAVIGTGTVAAPEIPGDGRWSTWSWTLNADETMTLAFGEVSQTMPVPAGSVISRVFVDSEASGLGGVWIDDVQIVPEPATLGLLGLGALGLIRRRR